MSQFIQKPTAIVVMVVLSLNLLACTRVREDTGVTPTQGVTLLEGLPTTEGEGNPTTIAIIPTPTATLVSDGGQSADSGTVSATATATTAPPTLPTAIQTNTPITSIPNPNSGSTTDQSITHTVQQGENLYRIGRTYSVSVEELVQFNGLDNPNTIYVGQQLRIPRQAIAADGVHIVQPGDTLLSISLRYGTTSEVLQQLNNLANPNLIYVGQELQLP